LRENGEINFNKRSGDDPKVSSENNKERNKWGRLESGVGILNG